MRRNRAFNSLYAVLLTSLPLAALTILLWRSGSQAFSPGELSANSQKKSSIQGFTSHYEFNNECSRCHKPLVTTQENLCMECHSNLKAEMETSDGIHGYIDDADNCATCHSEHKGQKFDQNQKATQLFDHTLTGFSLNWHQYQYDTTPMGCAACHSNQDGFQLSLNYCVECHSANDPEFMQQHSTEFGQNCTNCHDGIDKMTQFDHQNTRFPLEGKHAPLRCSACHGTSFAGDTGESNPQNQMAAFSSTPVECVGCHQDPESHRNLFSPDCSTCHNISGWKPAILSGANFEHTLNTGFSLALHRFDYENQPMDCKDCHPGELTTFDPQVCSNCHSKSEELAVFMAEHTKKYGTFCLDCHDGADRMVNFDHNTFFPLDGQHTSITCEACHVNKTFSGTPAECVDCHAEPMIHAGFFGLECQNCHSSESWSPAQLREHSFPLNHGENVETDCQVCHDQRYTQYTCYGCHEHQPNPIEAEHAEEEIFEPELSACAECHPYGQEDD